MLKIVAVATVCLVVSVQGHDYGGYGNSGYGNGGYSNGGYGNSYNVGYNSHGYGDWYGDRDWHGDWHGDRYNRHDDDGHGRFWRWLFNHGRDRHDDYHDFVQGDFNDGFGDYGNGWNRNHDGYGDRYGRGWNRNHGYGDSYGY